MNGAAKITNDGLNFANKSIENPGNWSNSASGSRVFTSGAIFWAGGGIFKD
jgi:hypothetical protein